MLRLIACRLMLLTMICASLAGCATSGGLCNADYATPSKRDTKETKAWSLKHNKLLESERCPDRSKGETGGGLSGLGGLFKWN